MSLRFVTNLRPGTYESFAAVGHRPAAWLLSSHRLDGTTARLAGEVRAQGQDLYADNGTKALIDDVVDAHAPGLADLAREVRLVRRGLPDGRRIPRPSELPDGLASRASDAAHAVMDAVDGVLAEGSGEELLAAQLSMDPTHLVAREDFAVASLLALGLEREVTRWPVGYFDRRNRITLGLWEEAAEDARCRDVDVFATLGATDYNTARSGARLFARRGVRHVAVGFAGINRDSSFCASYLHGPRRRLPGAAPRRYVRTTEITLGVRDGYREEGRELASFHALGLGARAQLPTLVAAFDPGTRLSVDATSPLHDAIQDRVFYERRAFGDRVSCREGARAVLEGGTWDLASPFARAVIDQLGHDPEGARAWWRAEAQRDLELDDLDPDSMLGRHLPLFATARGGRTATQARARTGHNHWVMDEICARCPDHGRAAWAAAAMEELVAERTRGTRYGVMASREILGAHGD
jgi:hypothetical protein